MYAGLPTAYMRIISVFHKCIPKPCVHDQYHRYVTKVRLYGTIKLLNKHPSFGGSLYIFEGFMKKYMCYNDTSEKIEEKLSNKIYKYVIII